MRKKTIIRKTKETNVEITLNLDLPYGGSIDTGIAFLDHMLDAFAFNANVYLDINASGDLDVDDHHTVEDVGITLGQVLNDVLFQFPIKRYAYTYIPMDEALSRVVLDVSNRSFLQYNVALKRERIGTMTLDNFEEFFRALVSQSRITLHIENLYGNNDHHIIESVFKAFGQSLKEAIVKTDNTQSTKGVLWDM